jgi:16S rRNA G1207 methylase RsmC
MNAVDYKDEKDYVLGAIDLVTDIVEREAGLAIYKANMRRDVAILVAGYKDETTRSVHEKFEKFVNSAKKRFSKKGS